MLRRLAAALLILVLAAPLPALAQGYGGYGREPDGYGRPRGGGYDRAGERRAGPAPYPRGGFYAPMGQIYRRDPNPYAAPSGPRGPARGGYMPPAARGAVVNNYGAYHLRRPPRGYDWHRVGGAFVLVSAATGEVFEVIPAGEY